MRCIAAVTLFVVSFQFRLVFCENYNLHQVMDESEVRRFFAKESKMPQIPQYDVVPVRVITKREVARIAGAKHNLQFTAFERPIHLRLQPNYKLWLPGTGFWSIDPNGNRKEIFGEKQPERCAFLHHDENSVAALSNCNGNMFEGFVALSDRILEMQPINQRLLDILRQNESFTIKHDSVYLIKQFEPNEELLSQFRATRSMRSVDSSKTPTMEPNSTELPLETTSTYDNTTLEGEATETTTPTPLPSQRLIKKDAQLTVEVGLFFDEAAYKIFAPLYNYDDRKIAEMLLVYMNGVQVLYHHPSLGIPVDISIVHMEIMRRQPNSLPTYNGERDQLLDSFCEYQDKINPPQDSDQNHWDMALYVSGLDFYGYENGINSGATMGLATVRGVCTGKYACIIAEYGVTNTFGRPYPSAGFNSVYILAHEMGHNLGMSHDSSGNYCSREGYIMSPSRGTQGETSWSPCSADIARELFSWADCLKDRPLATPKEYNAWKYQGYPGQKWSAKKQCELLLTDKDATVSITSSLQGICQNLQCRSPHRSGFFFAGPALEGTECGGSNWCEGGYCSPKRNLPKPENVTRGGWSDWKNEKCNSGCISSSKGHRARRRTCTNPVPVNTNEGCDGPSYDVTQCNDELICRAIKRRQSPITYASAKCRDFSRVVPALDPKGIGLQATHEPTRLWMGCAIFCRRSTTGSFYTPRLELNDLGIDPYFPDGTLCHVERKQKYYCLQHHCLPEGFEFNKNSLILLSEDVPISGNANPNPMRPLNAKLRDYLSLDATGKPLLQHIKIEDLAEYADNEKWVDDVDFRIVPSLKRKSEY